LREFVLKPERSISPDVKTTAVTGHCQVSELARIQVLSAQRRTATKRRSGAAPKAAQAARVAAAAEPVIEGSGDRIVEQPAARRAAVPKPPTVEERARARSEAKAAARQDAEKSAKSGGIASKLISSERTSGVRKFTRDTMAEIKKVNWPDQDTTRNLTIVVIGVSVALGLILGGLDFVLFKLFEVL
jgi:preprotein translocase subunit SecE